MPRTLLYLPGIDGTGKLLFAQHGLHERYDVLCEAYPQDRETTYEALVDAALARLEAEADGPAIVLAESFGGGVALQVALAKPELVERLVLINTFARYPRATLAKVGATLSPVLSERPAPLFTFPLRAKVFFSNAVPRAIREEWMQRTADVPAAAYGRRTRMLARLDLLEQLPTIQIPTYVLAAPNDLVVPHRGGLEIARLIPGAKLIKPRAGHAAMVHPIIDMAALIDDWKEPEPR